MPELEYSHLIESALRGVVREVLREVADHGLPGEHHFLLTFRTQGPGVVLPPALVAQYPEEMQIVLQHQFRDLQVDEERFSVYLRFSGVEYPVTVPFAALTAFADPSVRFALQFRHFSEVEGAEPPEASAEPEPELEEDAKVLKFESAKKD